MSGPSWSAASTFEIISIGDAEMLSAAFNGLAAITSSDGFGNMMRVAFLVGILGFALRVLLTSRFEAAPLLASMILYLIMFAPKVNVLVIDAYNGTARPVANVPIGLAAPFSLVSKTGQYFASTFETAFSVIMPGSSYLGAGYLDALTVLLRMRDVQEGSANSNASTDGNFNASLQNYLVSCAYYDIELADPIDSMIKPEELRKAGEIWPKLKTGFLNVTTLIYPPYKGIEGEQLSCRDAYNTISAFWINNPAWTGGALDSYLKVVIEQSRGMDMPAQTRIQGALDAIGLASESALKYSLNSLLYNKMRKAEAGYAASRNDLNATIITTQAENQRNVQWTAERTMFEKVARPITSFIEVFMVAVTPMMAFAIAAMGTAGITAFGMFLKFHLWVTLWLPTLTIANMYTFTVVNRFIQYIKDMPPADSFPPLSIVGLDYVTQGLQTQFATGSMLAAATPMLTLMLIYGSSQVASMLAHKASSADHIDTKVASPPIVSPGALVQNTPYQTANPLSGRGGVVTGAAEFTSNFGQIGVRSVTSARQATIDATRGVEASIGRSYALSDGTAAKIGSVDGKTWTTGAGQGRALAAALTTGSQAVEGLNLKATESSRLRSTFANTMSGGGGVGFDLMALKKAIGLGIKFSAEDTVSNQLAKSADVGPEQAAAFLNNVSKQAQTTDSHTAQLMSMISSDGGIKKEYALNRTATADSNEGFADRLTDLHKASQSYTQSQMFNQTASNSDTFTPSTLFGAGRDRAMSQGVPVTQYADELFQKAYKGNPEEQKTALQDLRNNPAFNSVAGGRSEAERDASAKLWLMTRSEADAAHLIVPALTGRSVDSTRNVDAQANRGLANTVDAQVGSGAATAKAAAHLPASGAKPTSEVVQERIAQGQQYEKKANKEIENRVGPKDLKVGYVQENADANSRKVAVAQEQGVANFEAAATKLTGAPVHASMEFNGSGSMPLNPSTSGDMPKHAGPGTPMPGPEPTQVSPSTAPAPAPASASGSGRRQATSAGSSAPPPPQSTPGVGARSQWRVQPPSDRLDPKAQDLLNYYSQLNPTKPVGVKDIKDGGDSGAPKTGQEERVGKGRLGSGND